MNRPHFLPGFLAAISRLPGFAKYKMDKNKPIAYGSAIYPTHHHRKPYRGYDLKKYHHGKCSRS